MVNPSIDEAAAVFGFPFIDAVQFHGNEDEAFCAHFAKLERPFFKAVALRDQASVDKLGLFHTTNILLDAYSPDAFGGTGTLINLDLAGTCVVNNPAFSIVLSGGLTPDNVREAVGRVRPYAVDVASGVEREPRRKDRRLMEAFICEASGN
jgi:phosphoribosylanthranilate isomerase